MLPNAEVVGAPVTAELPKALEAVKLLPNGAEVPNTETPGVELVAELPNTGNGAVVPVGAPNSGRFPKTEAETTGLVPNPDGGGAEEAIAFPKPTVATFSNPALGLKLNVLLFMLVDVKPVETDEPNVEVCMPPKPTDGFCWLGCLNSALIDTLAEEFGFFSSSILFLC